MGNGTRIVINLNDFRFIFFRNPNDMQDSHLKDFNWTPVQNDEDNFLEIDVKFEMKQKMFSERYSFWNELFPLSN